MNREMDVFQEACMRLGFTWGGIDRNNPDGDWAAALACGGFKMNPDTKTDSWVSGFSINAAHGVALDDLAAVVHSATGENDGDEWIAVFRLTDGRFGMLSAGCDYTGWDCRSGGRFEVADTWEALCRGVMGDHERHRFGYNADGTSRTTHPVLAALVLVFDDNKPPHETAPNSKVLAIRRSDGYISFPGGGLEADESPTEAAIRETLEETGLNVLVFGGEPYEAPAVRHQGRCIAFPAKVQVWNPGSLTPSPEGIPEWITLAEVVMDPRFGEWNRRMLQHYGVWGSD